MHDPQLMMAIIVASAALFGLTGVVIGQARESRLRNHKQESITKGLTWVLGFLAFTMIVAIFWFYSPQEWEKNLAIGTLILEVIAFLLLAGAFWEMKEEAGANDTGAESESKTKIREGRKKETRH